MFSHIFSLHGNRFVNVWRMLVWFSFRYYSHANVSTHKYINTTRSRLHIYIGKCIQSTQLCMHMHIYLTIYNHEPTYVSRRYFTNCMRGVARWCLSSPFSTSFTKRLASRRFPKDKYLICQFSLDRQILSSIDKSSHLTTFCMMW